MDEATRARLIAAGRPDLVEVWDINQSGYAGIKPGTGTIVDRRKHPDAIPVQGNKLLGIPASKQLDGSCRRLPEDTIVICQDCKEKAVADYNGYGVFLCEYHLKKENDYFDEEYR